MIMLICLGAVYFGRFVAFSRVADNIATFLAGSGVPNLGVIGLFMLMYLFLGCFLEATSVMLITLPVVFPVAMNFGFDPIWLGVLFVKTIEIGLVTPPVGLTVYIVSAASGVPLPKIFFGVLPFVVADVCVLTLLVAFPEIALWLPHVLKG
jgi:TRAP-type C4-dicarboxylate transport system permease large subunit